MNQEYSLGGDLVTVGSGGLNDIIKGTVGAHYNIALGAIVVLALIIVVLVVKKESFNPTATAKMQKVALSGSEAMDGGNASSTQAWTDMGCAQNTPIGDDAWSWMYGQLQGASNVVDPTAAAHGNSGAYATTQGAVYQNETFSGKKMSDNTLTAIANGF